MNDLLEQIKDELEIRGYEARVMEVPKNNTIKRGISIVPADGFVSPTIYADVLSDMSSKGMDIREIASEIINMTNNIRPDFGFDVSRLSDGAFIREHSYLTLVKYDWNQDLLSDSVWTSIPGTDLAAVVRVEIADDASFRLTKSALEMAGLSEQEALDAAMENTMNRDYKVMTMAEALGLPAEMNIGDMLVITSGNSFNGASALLSHDVLESARQMSGSEEVFIIPSSVHELIVVSSSVGDADMLSSMIQDINETQVRPEERLSNQPYLFDGKTISIANSFSMEKAPGRSR